MYEELKEILKNGKRVVFFGGAGVSTESGIPDFRSKNGLYNAKRDYGLSPEEILSRDFFNLNTEIFFKYYKTSLISHDVHPNKAHIALAKLEDQGKLLAIITQNIDGLHQMAGSKIVYELHGSIQKNTCVSCNAHYKLPYIMDPSKCKNGVPKCEKCGATIKPDVVLYGELLDEECINAAVLAIKNADVLIIGGTSLVVYPAASFVQYFSGDKLVLINHSATIMDQNADLVIHDTIGEVLFECLRIK